MSLTAFYDNSTDLVALYGLPPSAVQLPQRAENGEAAFGLLPFEDPAAGLTLTGHRPIWVAETECVTQPRLFTGWVVSREFGRSLADGLIVADDRLSGVNIVDANAGANFIVISGTDGNRPQETWNARLAWLVASDYLSPFIGGDTTYFGSYTQTMDAADYRGSYAASVLDDLKERTGGVLNWFLFWNPDTSAVELFIKREQYTIGTCPLRISNVLADIDGSVTFGADTMAKLTREPDLVYSEVIVEYGDGQKVYRSLESTELAHVRRGTTISRPYTKREATAIAQADQWLAAHSVERDRITCVMRSVPADSVGLVRAGMGIDVKFSHMPGYDDYVEMRIVMCSPVPVSDIGDLYDISLELLRGGVAPSVCPDPTPSATFWPLGGSGTTSNPSPGDGNLMYNKAGNSTPMVPTPGHQGEWNFPSWGAGGSGTEDIAGDCASNIIRVAVTGPGTLTLNTVQHGGHACPMNAYLAHSEGAFGILDSTTPFSAGDSPVITVPASPWCDFYVDITDDGEPHTCGASWGFTGAVWVAGDSPTGDPLDVPIQPSTTVSAAAPTVNDDESIGFSVGDRWIDTTTGTEYVLVDATDGAAVWIVTAPHTTGAPTTADYLVGTAQAGLSAEIVVGTTPGGELGGTWASPTVDATHAGSTHLALGSTSTTAAAGDHTHASYRGELLISDTPSTPLVFADILQNEDQDDLLYAD